MYPTWKGFEIKPSRSADREMQHLRIYLDDVLRILEEGRDCAKSKRKSGTIEKHKKIGGKLIKVVAVESETRWNGATVWLITHVGEDNER